MKALRSLNIKLLRAGTISVDSYGCEQAVDCLADETSSGAHVSYLLFCHGHYFLFFNFNNFTLCYIEKRLISSFKSDAQ